MMGARWAFVGFPADWNRGNSLDSGVRMVEQQQLVRGGQILGRELEGGTLGGRRFGNCFATNRCKLRTIPKGVGMGPARAESHRFIGPGQQGSRDRGEPLRKLEIMKNGGVGRNMTLPIAGEVLAGSLGATGNCCWFA
jgi:hypothetical protein